MRCCRARVFFVASAMMGIAPLCALGAVVLMPSAYVCPISSPLVAADLATEM